MIRGWLTTAVAAGALVTSAPALAAISQPRQHDTGTLVHTRSGVIQGTRADRVLRFLGVPYARPPVGPLRWRPPRPVRPWRGVRPARHSGPPCAQPDVPHASENCLYLDVTVPQRPGPKPVLVFLHGGGLTTGSGSDYNPARMAVQGDVIVVTVDFRLGIFGFFGHTGLPGSGTFGLQDQQAALRWVRGSIAAFGGEPGNVTLAGQSGGAVSTCAQLTSPRSAGLFQRAIMESGDCRLSWPRDAMYPPGPAGSFFQPAAAVDRRGQTAARALHCDRGSDRADLACLRALPPRALTGRQYDRFGVVATGNPVLPLNPATALRRGRFHRVPVMLGQTRDEHRLIAGIMADLKIWITARHYPAMLRESFGPHTPAVLRRYPLSRYHHNAEIAWSAVLTDRIWACGQVATAGDLARFTPVYTYEFADEHAQPLATLPPGFPAGASHGSELMDLFDVAGRQLITSSYYTPAQRRLARDLITYWTTFARTGRPSSAGLLAWPATRPGQAERPALRLAPGPGGIRLVDAAAEHQCGFWLR